MAARLDRPRRWVLEDAALEELACLQPDQRMRIRRALQSGRLRRQLELDSVIDALTEPPAATDSGGGRPDPTQQTLIDACLARVRAVAGELGMSASLLATRKEITQLVRGSGDTAILRGWRREVVGKELADRVAASR